MRCLSWAVVGYERNGSASHVARRTSHVRVEKSSAKYNQLCIIYQFNPPEGREKEEEQEEGGREGGVAAWAGLQQQCLQQ